MTNTIKLTTDALAAKQAALQACEACDDAGAANLDGTFYRLAKYERWHLVVEAFQAAGLSASPTRWIGRGVMVQPPGMGQGGKRWASNQALYTSLLDAGWPVSPFYQMD